MKCRKRLAFIGILVIFTLSACVNPPPRSVDSQDRRADLQRRGAEYCQQLHSDPRLDPIRDKVPLLAQISDPIPMQMMSNNEFPTNEEASAIAALAEQRQKCQKYQTVLLGAHPAHVEALRRTNSQLMAELYGGNITYGQYAKQLNQNVVLFLQQDAAIGAQAARDRLQAAQAFQQNLYQQQQLNLERQRLQNEQLRALQPQRNPPINCTTQYIGDQAYTNCR